MTGQDAANTAKAFGKVLPLTGIILTKVDADTRGGAALSVRTITERPIKFLGVGEKTDALDPFHPDRLASRILGMGDMLSLIEDVERKVDQTKAKKLAKKVQKGGRFDLEDFREQLQQMKNLGGMGAMLDKMPGMGGMAQAAQNLDTQQFVRMEAMINSMTPRERRNPDLISGSRKRRITGGSGTVIQDLNRLLKQHKQMQKMMKKMKGGGMQRMMRGMGGMTGGPGGGLPPGFPR
jgi:signal recognition particle subunit SRP54